MSPPTVALFIDGIPAGRLRCPEPIEPRAWILGVAAVQISVENGGVQACLRVHVTGAPRPQIIELARSAVIHAVLAAAADPEPARLPAHPLPALAGAAARLTLALDGRPLASAALQTAALQAEPAPRAFGHVFCRWLRTGGIEPGVDITDFLSLPRGEKYRRLVSRRLKIGQIVSYGFAAVT